MRLAREPRPAPINVSAGLLLTLGVWHLGSAIIEVIQWALLFDNIPSNASQGMAERIAEGFGLFLIWSIPAIAIWVFAVSAMRWILAAFAIYLFLIKANSLFSLSITGGLAAYLQYNLESVGVAVIVCVAAASLFTPSAVEWLRRKKVLDAAVFD